MGLAASLLLVLCWSSQTNGEVMPSGFPPWRGRGAKHLRGLPRSLFKSEPSEPRIRILLYMRELPRRVLVLGFTWFTTTRRIRLV
jgi:hypothetical protein